MGTRARRMVISCGCILVLYCVCELMALAGMRLADIMRGYRLEAGVPVLSPDRVKEIETLLSPVEGGRNMISFDPYLGWVLRANFHKGGQKTNSAGIVALREYETKPPNGVLRIAAFGESFTQCVVPNGLTWEQVLEDSCRGIEVLNFGVSSYGPDQAYLRYMREGREYHPDIVLIGFMTENIWRLVNVVRTYADPMNSPLVKPRFILDKGELRLVENPLKSRDDLRELSALNSNQALRDRLGKHDCFYRRYNFYPPPSIVRWSPLARLAYDTFRMTAWKIEDARELNIIDGKGQYNTSSEAYRILEALLERWATDVAREGAVPVVLVFPQMTDIEKWRRGEKPKQYQPLLDFMKRKGLRSMDLMDAFRSCAVAGVFRADGHYSERGNRLVAARIGGSLQRWGLIPGPCEDMERP